MLKTDLITGFPFYRYKSKQHRNQQPQSGTDPWGLICGSTALLPFQIKRTKPSNSDSISLFQIISTSEDLAIDLGEKISLIQIYSTETDEYLIYNGDNLGVILPIGDYYVYVKKGNDEFFSEVFTVVCDLSPYLKLEWRNSGDIAPLLYQTGFKNILYIDSYVEASEPDVTQDGENNGEGEFIASFERVSHKHKIECSVPDFVFDALYLAQIHDNIQITEALETANVYHLAVKGTYPDNYLGALTLTFEVVEAYIKTSCISNLKLED